MERQLYATPIATFFTSAVSVINQYPRSICTDQGDHPETVCKELIRQRRGILLDFHHVYSTRWYIRNHSSSQGIGKTKLDGYEKAGTK